MITAAFLICGGLLAASSLIIAKKPNAKELIDKLTPYQGWIGIALFVWGIWDVISWVRILGVIFKVKLLLGIFLTVGVWTELLLGFLLGFGLITKYALSKNETALAKGQAIRAKLAPFAGIIGLTAIVVGVLLLVFRFI